VEKNKNTKQMHASLRSETFGNTSFLPDPLQNNKNHKISSEAAKSKSKKKT
jgi:hypothetical protein